MPGTTPSSGRDAGGPAPRPLPLRQRGERADRQPALTRRPAWIADGARAAVPAALLSGLPSTLHALLRRRHVLDAAAAAGALVAPQEQRRSRLVLYAVPVHAAISLFWSLVLARLLPARWTVAVSVAGGGAVAALDLGLVGRRVQAVRCLPQGPQVLDHLMFGALVGAVVARRRARRGSG